jgi:hypothetical protein
MGHGILIDGLNVGTLRLLDVASLKPDYVKVAWSAELSEAGNTNAPAVMGAVGAAVGEGKIIISRCESSKALSWGLKHGVTLFQGRFLDSLKSNRRRAG